MLVSNLCARAQNKKEKNLHDGLVRFFALTILMSHSFFTLTITPPPGPLCWKRAGDMSARTKYTVYILASPRKSRSEFNLKKNANIVKIENVFRKLCSTQQHEDIETSLTSSLLVKIFSSKRMLQSYQTFVKNHSDWFTQLSKIWESLSLCIPRTCLHQRQPSFPWSAGLVHSLLVKLLNRMQDAIRKTNCRCGSGVKEKRVAANGYWNTITGSWKRNRNTRSSKDDAVRQSFDAAV